MGCNEKTRRGIETGHGEGGPARRERGVNFQFALVGSKGQVSSWCLCMGCLPAPLSEQAPGCQSSLVYLYECPPGLACGAFPSPALYWLLPVCVQWKPRLARWERHLIPLLAVSGNSHLPGRVGSWLVKQTLLCSSLDYGNCTGVSGVASDLCWHQCEQTMALAPVLGSATDSMSDLGQVPSPSL